MVLRIGFLALVLVPFTLLFLPVQLLALKFWPAKSHILPKTFFAILAFGLGLKVRLAGEPVAKGPVLFVCNHISWLDIVAIGSKLPVRFVAKSDVAKYPLVGFMAGLQRTILVDRTRRFDTRRTTTAMADALDNGDGVVLFAEGTSDMGTHVLPFRSALMGAVGKAVSGESGKAPLIQPMAIAYLTISGLPISRHERRQVAWIGDMGLGDNLGQILSSGRKEIALALGTPIDGQAERKAVAWRAEKTVREMLVALNRQQPLPKGEVSL